MHILHKTGKIAFQGERGANSDIACGNMYPDMQPIACATFEDAFNAVQSGEADLAMIPIENSLAGRVADIHHLLPQTNLYIIGEYFLPIHFQLMVLPSVTREEIKTVHSHIHALGQCRNIIRENSWKAVIAEDTAGAAKLIADKKDRSMAALASRKAAELYGLEILQENVEDAADNMTRFIIASKQQEFPPLTKEEKFITSLIFQVRNLPSALYKALGGFATCGINMSKIESYQMNATFQATQFYVEIEGHADEPYVALALEELKFFVCKFRIIGIYPASLFRFAQEKSVDEKSAQEKSVDEKIIHDNV